ncbi:MAG: D-alanyl-D-alanine carboxypeptidase family protein, partial [Bacteroidota bacterium]
NLPLQPETKAVMTAIKKFKPDRILSLHGISDTDHGGVFADPVEGQARELACRMAVLSLGELDKGKWSAEINVRGNRVAKGVCEARYPGSPPKIFKEHTSLGSYASQDKALGGLGTMVITHEVAGKGHLADKGKGRSLETLMPGIREFLLDHENERSVADDLLRSHVDKDFLQGNSGGKSLASKNIKLAVADRFEDMNTYYKKVWRPKAPDKKSLPRALKIVSSYRSFKDQARIVKGQLKKQKITTKSTEAEIKKALLDILTTRSMPGFSRHHWGTEIDVQSAKRSDWIKGGRYEPLIPFLREEARKFGFFHPYSQAYPAQGIAGFPDASLPHYQEEPWHLSYAPIANVVQEEWAKQFQGKELEKLIEETAKAIASSKKNKQHIEDIKKALKSIGIANFQTNVSPAP